MMVCGVCARVCVKRKTRKTQFTEMACVCICACVLVCATAFFTHSHTEAASDHAKNEGERNKSHDKCCIALHLFHLTDNPHSIHVLLNSLK